MQIQYFESNYGKFQSGSKREKSQDDNDSANNLLAHNKASSLNSVFLSYQEFYIKKLDSFDLFKEYLRWEQLRENESK